MFLLSLTQYEKENVLFSYKNYNKHKHIEILLIQIFLQIQVISFFRIAYYYYSEEYGIIVSLDIFVQFTY